MWTLLGVSAAMKMILWHLIECLLYQKCSIDIFDWVDEWMSKLQWQEDVATKKFKWSSLNRFYSGYSSIWGSCNCKFLLIQSVILFPRLSLNVFFYMKISLKYFEENYYVRSESPPPWLKVFIPLTTRPVLQTTVLAALLSFTPQAYFWVSPQCPAPGLCICGEHSCPALTFQLVSVSPKILKIAIPGTKRSRYPFHRTGYDLFTVSK